MILIVIFALLTQSLVIVQRLATPVKLQGLVEVQRSGKGDFTPLSNNTPIKTGDVVRSGKDGIAEFKWVDGTRWKIMPNTEIIVKKATANWIKKADTSELELTTGKVFIRIMKELTPASKFEVETPTAVAAVRGTIFSVEVAHGQTQVAVFKGHVKVTSGDSHHEAMINPGQAAVSAQVGALETISSATADAQFASQPTIIQPELTARITQIGTENKALVRGTTEAGDIVTVNDNPVQILSNGLFNHRVTLQPGQNIFNVVTLDRHGVKTTKVLTFTMPKEICN
ncbi:MAG: FecR domain-containing protein, partial [Abitibacteriaceae bacterium]|nr:FecR domain-containing protein [Abditibacteriaceae bacterium]